MEDHTFMATEPSHLDDGIPLHHNLAHHLRVTRTPPSTRPHTQHAVYAAHAGLTYADYPIHSYDSSLPTPVSGAGSPGSSHGTPEMRTIKHEPGNGLRSSTSSCSRTDWPYSSTIAYHSHPHSPAALQHGFPEYDGIESPGDSDNQHPGVTEAPFWPSRVMDTESNPYPIMVDMPSTLVRHDMTLSHDSHGLHAPQHQQNHHHHHQSRDMYEQRHFHDQGSSTVMRGETHPYPSFSHVQPGPVLGMNTATIGQSNHVPPKTRASRTPKKSPVVRRSRPKRPKPRPRAAADDKPEKYPKDPEERVKFDENIKEEDKFLYNLRCDLGARNGEDMWDLIVREYAKRYNHKQKATLQMQLQRAVVKHQVWPESERSLLADIMQDIVPIIRDELKQRGGSSAMEFCNEQILAQLVREGHISIDPETSASDSGARRTKLMIPRSNKPRTASKGKLKSQDQLANLTGEQLDYIFKSQAQSDLCSSESEPWQNGTSHLEFAGTNDCFSTMAGTSGQFAASGAASTSLQDAARARQSYHIAASNGSIAPI